MLLAAIETAERLIFYVLIHRYTYYISQCGLWGRFEDVISFRCQHSSCYGLQTLQLIPNLFNSNRLSEYEVYLFTYSLFISSAPPPP